MATWEPKLPSSFHETSLWSLKSSAASATTAADHNHHHFSWSPLGSSDSPTTATMADKSLLSALNKASPPSRQFATSGDKLDQPTDFQHDGDAGAHGYGSATTNSSTAPNRGSATIANKLLGGAGALGTGSGKVTKKRARASRKPPTTVLEADSSNFRAMVQQLTGIPSVPFLSSSMHQRNGLEFLDLGRPPTATRSILGFAGPHHQALQGLPPLDPSALLPAFGSRAHSEATAAGFGSSSPYFKYMSAAVAASAAPHEHSRQQQAPPSMGDFLRTPLDELGLDQNASSPLLSSLDQQQQHEQQRVNLPRKLESSELSSMPSLWEGGGDSSSRELQATNCKTEDGGLEHGTDDTGDQEGSNSRMVHIVDSWLSHADQTTDHKQH
ncbi:uncharacterized protein LOC9635173 [Selaginella moellendorffii]|nr:uncharacterized protein LOC9635173 [Selaginella moellendorffii]|eukprot:XP_002979646.2 uncharacterized protein LOC9635173 [Selaginella moellendorffii]